MERIENDIPVAMRAKESLRLETLRSIKTALITNVHNKAVMTPDAEASLLKTMAKQRHESAVVFRNAGREELAYKEELEGAIIKQYMPPEASPEEIEIAVSGVLGEMLADGPIPIKRMGEVMKRVGVRLGKRADGRVVSDLVRSRIGA